MFHSVCMQLVKEAMCMFNVMFGVGDAHTSDSTLLPASGAVGMYATAVIDR